MKSNQHKRSDLSHRYHTRVMANVMYSTLVTCLVELFLVTNLSMLADYAEEAQWSNALLARISSSDTVIVLGYVIFGIAIFTLTFLILQEKSIAYISRISDAIESISEGDLNTSVEVVGDDEFSS
ncbi:MAG TPA: two-component sensor histidine kinase, partial [Candidatus Ventrimonas merdavium]|nr:two-component sensor histidine kinase [Candidatus Ventrimonas merdavium]